MDDLLARIAGCRVCAPFFEHEPRPIVAASPISRLLIIGQAPGRVVHRTGVPWNDASGDRLRDWLGIDRERFYDPKDVAIMPMGFCYPGHGSSGDLPPRPECAPLWHQPLLDALPNLGLTLLVGRFAVSRYLSGTKVTLTEAVENFDTFLPRYFPLPHPSPRNRPWVRRHPWFEARVLPILKRQVADLFASPSVRVAEK